MVQAISVIVTHRTDDMSCLPSIATKHSPVKEKPHQEPRLMLRLNPVPASSGAVASAPEQAAANSPSRAAGAGAADAVMGPLGDPSVQEGVGSPGDSKPDSSRSGDVLFMSVHEYHHVTLQSRGLALFCCWFQCCIAMLSTAAGVSC